MFDQLLHFQSFDLTNVMLNSIHLKFGQVQQGIVVL